MLLTFGFRATGIRPPTYYMLGYFLLLILGYFLFRLIFNLILPIIRSTRVIRQGFAHMHEETRPKPTPPPNAHKNASPNWDKMGDYIDFEEVK